ncbi:MAG: DUF4193 family protein [Actinomycetota bacterium]
MLERGDVVVANDEDELTALGDDELAVEDDEDLEPADDDPDADALPVAATDDEDGEDPSVEELLTQRTPARRVADEAEEDDDIMALASERDIPLNEPLPTKVVPIKDRAEFVCARCRLVKLKSQLVDEQRTLCRDCV